MQDSGSANYFVLAIAVLALVLATVAITTGTRTEQVSQVDQREDPELAELKNEIRSLRQEMSALQMELVNALDNEFMDAIRATDEERELPVALVERIAVLEDKLDEVEQRELRDPDELEIEKVKRAVKMVERNKTTEAISDWLDGSQERLDSVVRRAVAKLSLDKTRARDLRRVLEETGEEQFMLLEELNADPPPSDEEHFEIVGEIKQTYSQRNEQLREILTDEELETFQIIEKAVATEHAEQD